MTDEELDRVLQQVAEEIGRLSDDEKELTKQESSRRHLLLSQQEVLKKMQLAREKKDSSTEMQLGIIYGILTSWVAKYPLLLQLVLNLRGKRPLF